MWNSSPEELPPRVRPPELTVSWPSWANRLKWKSDSGYEYRAEAAVARKTWDRRIFSCELSHQRVRLQLLYIVFWFSWIWQVVWYPLTLLRNTCRYQSLFLKKRTCHWTKQIQAIWYTDGEIQEHYSIKISVPDIQHNLRFVVTNYMGWGRNNEFNLRLAILYLTWKLLAFFHNAYEAQCRGIASESRHCSFTTCTTQSWPTKLPILYWLAYDFSI